MKRKENNYEWKTTIADVKVSPLPDFSSAEISEIRDGLCLSQSVFADILGVSKKTVEAWERGTNKPNGPACRMLKRFKEDPESVKEYLIYA